MTSVEGVPVSFLIAGTIRYLLMASKYSTFIGNRVEISTPLNSWKRVQEGAFLFGNNINPYIGDMYHENPLVLVASSFLLKYFAVFVPVLFVIIDLATAGLLYKMSKGFVKQMIENDQLEVDQKRIKSGTEEIQNQLSDIVDIPTYVLMAYLYNPYTILNCVGMTTTVWSNFLLSALFWALSRKQTLLSCIFLALETQRNFYPFVLIVPTMLVLSENKENKRLRYLQVFSLYVFVLAALNSVGFLIVGDWSFLYATYGFIFNHDDLQPNIGLFWYFFTEMFEHFRTLFLYTLQLNATVLYVLPLSIKLHRQPLLLATTLTALVTIFRSYPCVGDVGFYMALLPLWKRSGRFMANTFVVFCLFVIASALGPIVWYLWIYCNSANANFYFGATLALSSAQIFLVTDLLFATNKRDFCLTHGMDAINKITMK